MTDDEKSAKFRKDATRVFRTVVACLFVAAAGLAALGWWIGHWRGLGIGAALGFVTLVVGLTASGMLYAMTQDGA